MTETSTEFITSLKYETPEENEDFKVEYEVLPAYDLKSYTSLRGEIQESIKEIDLQNEALELKLDKLNSEIDRLTNHADGIDYTIAVASGILCGLLDVFVVGEFDLEEFNKEKEKVREQFKEKVENKYLKEDKKKKIQEAVKSAKEKAKKNGKKLSQKEINELKQKVGKNVEDSFEKLKNSENGPERALRKAISNLEKMYKIPSDNLHQGHKIGVNSVQHHLDDLAHHPSILGLVALFVSELFRIGIFVNKDGKYHLVFANFKTKDGEFDKEAFQKYLLSVILPILISVILIWLVRLAKKKKEKNSEENQEDEKIPKPIQKLVEILALTPVAIEALQIISNWLGHLASDMAGSSTSAGKGKDGMGIPGILLSSLKELSNLPLIKDTKLPAYLEELFTKQNAILKVSKDKNLSDEEKTQMIQKLMNDRFDLRAEIALLKQVGKQQMWPVILNGVIVRTLYFTRHLIVEIKEKRNFKEIEWKNIIPFRNRTIVRMLTIATGTFTTIDLAGAAIEGYQKGGAPVIGGVPNPLFFKEFVLRVNFVGIGRFAIAVGTDIGMGVKRKKLINERIECNAKIIRYTNSKIYYLVESNWILAKDLEECMQNLYKEVENCVNQISSDYAAIQEDIKIFGEKVNKIEKLRPGVRERLKERAIWGN